MVIIITGFKIIHTFSKFCKVFTVFYFPLVGTYKMKWNKMKKKSFLPVLFYLYLRQGWYKFQNIETCSWLNLKTALFWRLFQSLTHLAAVGVGFIKTCVPGSYVD